MKLGHFHLKPFGERMLLTNDAGSFVFVTPTELGKMLGRQLDREDGTYQQLLQRGFLYEGDREPYVNRTKDAVRDNKRYLFGGTSLFIFVVSTLCNGACVYCQASAGGDCGMNMDVECARRAVDIALSSPNRYLSFEFQGGEPLMNFSVIQDIVRYADERKGDKQIDYSVVSNLTLLTEQMLAFFVAHRVSISTSLDGSEALHNLNRPLKSGSDSFEQTAAWIRRLNAENIPIGAIQTTTRDSLSEARKLIETYCELGFASVFIRPLTPLGFASEHWGEIGYTAQEFVAFYRECLLALMNLNRQGIRMHEGHASIFLAKILGGYSTNYMELRSPCGASVGQMAFYCDGGIFTCDEGRMLAEMGDNSFRLGSVFTHHYEQLIESPVCKAACSASVLECAPACYDCAYQPYCGTCPVINLALDGDVFARQPKNDRCLVYAGMLDTLFELIERDDPGDIEILKSWI